MQSIQPAAQEEVEGTSSSRLAGKTTEGKSLRSSSAAMSCIDAKDLTALLQQWEDAPRYSRG